ncbi:MAG: PAS domain S-box protein [Rhodoferax sp.]|uniref:PAS domain-containing sensor histidine kinase n=1 Tax=Rhodoferax sp. TaxID=50421 RepID=UPI00261CFFDC|nr:PAS domain S-box protein [Rhodoferax sp.]MDD2880122.1 PAS domain S-box protein [Rhodoferax sp.]
MTATHKTSPAKPTLRLQAEVAARDTTASAAEHTQDLSPIAMRKLIHELRVHQIELELQNDELRRTQAERDMAQARYFDFYDLAPVGYFTLDLQGLILQANLTSASQLGVARSKLHKHKLDAFIHHEDQDSFYLMRKKASTSNESQSCELRLIKPKTKPIWVRVDAIAAVEDDDTPVLRLVVIDISERKRLEASQLANSKFRDAILDSVSAQIAVLDSDGIILAVNQTWREFARDNRTEPAEPDSGTYIGVNYLDLCLAIQEGDAQQDAAQVRNGILQVIAGSLPNFHLDYHCHSPTTQRWFNLSVTPMNLEGHGVVVTHTDITEQKRLQAAELTHAVEGGLATSRQQLRELVALNEAEREEERKHIAREVHDELGQFLTALRMDLSLMTMRFGALDTALVTQVDASKALVDRAIRSVRRVAANLRPPELDLGLVTALEFLCKEFNRHNGAACQLKLSVPYIAVDDAHTVVIFRIVQESLTNVARYAQATQVIVDLGCDGTQLGLEIRDNGQGFDMAAVAARKTLGLLGMRERALALAGHLEVISAPGQGTVVAVTIPLDLNMNQPNP